MADSALLLDTHCWLWAQFGQTEKFSRLSRRMLDRAAQRGELRVSIISVWEIGLLDAKGRVSLKMSCLDWVNQALTTPGLSLFPLTPEIAIESSRLPGEIHADPADRILLATARITGARLLTKDQRLLDYGRQRHAMIVPA
jgi:PIN domain nuclease of toxin-antitoxin system